MLVCNYFLYQSFIIHREESNVIEEKRKQLAAEEVRLQKESQALMEQKKLLEEQKQNYQV